MVLFGKYKELLYCHSHFKSGSPGLRDLVNYTKARGFDSENQAVIPGSHLTRVCKEK